MKVLVINAGSSSIKYQLLDMSTGNDLASGIVERIGEEMGSISYKTGEKYTAEQPFPTHREGMVEVINLLTDADKGVVKDKAEIAAIGHRIVHGGELFFEPVEIDDKVLQGIRDCIPLAPLHNPGHVIGIETAMELFPGVRQVAVFDTSFHQTMEPKAYMYGVPYKYYEDWGLRRYGAHGTSHKYVARETAKLLGKPLEESNIITVHLGNGASISAVKNGKCYDTSMGLTPLGGIIMGTRCGDIDPAIVGFIAERTKQSAAEVVATLTNESGLKGICGSNDLRDIHARIEEGDEKAKLALDMACHKVRQFIGAYAFELGRVDAIVFTAGIGENDEIYRENCLSGLENFGITINKEKNENWDRTPSFISEDDGAVKVAIIATNEELEIANDTVKVLGL
ncbi:acetate kinase [Maridesulfovibrio salexigens]|uniref:Acetate kinase n=1 Tax=Maridesulfovibrio salexigens (strain ATCC 14822 / DSM 2638 / NCIMB 8403 / VKM B-1763) TaxID=526222 RepID=ACKA_MARSD|nr:acetate kinase [Maridesulfovibrio salexigens]C6BYL8.1 RecName: Full=Acetate kinase; AltName: Full=Acetokinase [Maridesulfovibrio salexigens DSM 2638]ACS80625.1 acetate kinase [Maridesulfovibrio salexigens DSM 2638]